MENHPDKANQRHGVFKNLILPVHPSLIFFTIKPIFPISLTVSTFSQNTTNVLSLVNDWLPQQIRFLASDNTTAKTVFQGTEMRLK